MKLFKKCKTKETAGLSFGIKDCRTCDNNLRCEECVYLKQNDIIKAEIERLKAFKAYFDELYGKGLDVANWHLNGELEPFDCFYESALQEMDGDERNG